MLIARPTFLFGGHGAAETGATSAQRLMAVGFVCVPALALPSLTIVRRVSLVGVFGTAGACVSFSRSARCGRADSHAAVLTIRAIGPRAHALHSLTSFSAQSVLAALALSLPFSPLHRIGFEAFVLPASLFQATLFVIIGTLGFVAQALMTIGLQRESAGRGAVGMYAQIVFAGIFDVVLFHAHPSVLSVVGTIVIVASALYVAVRAAWLARSKEG
jgi:drug/metabolite transporter (DMT)-like permease